MRKVLNAERFKPENLNIKVICYFWIPGKNYEGILEKLLISSVGLSTVQPKIISEVIPGDISERIHGKLLNRIHGGISKEIIKDIPKGQFF